MRNGADTIGAEATHCFDETIIDTAIKQNQNPIEKLERAMAKAMEHGGTRGFCGDGGPRTSEVRRLFAGFMDHPLGDHLETTLFSAALFVSSNMITVTNIK